MRAVSGAAMGFSNSWIAVEGERKQSVLEALELTETGQEAEFAARFAGAQLANGWYVILSSHFEFAPERLAAASADGVAIGGQVEEHVMFSALRGFENGVEAWWVTHDPEKGIYDLGFGGTPPKQLAEIRDRLVSTQQAEGGEDADVDFIFEVPVKLGVALCGYRVDGGEGVEDPEFFVLTPPRRPGLFERLFGRS